jgi:MFS family permease
MPERLGLPALLTASVVSSAGTRISQIAVPWLVLETTQSPVLTGLVGTAEIAPYVVLQLVGAPLVDRLGARRIAIVGDAIAAVAMGVIPVLHVLGGLTLPLVLALVFIAGCARGPADAAGQVLVPRAASGSNVSLDRAAGLVDGAERLASILGAALAGVLIAVLGAAPVITLDAVSFLVAAALLTLVPSPAPDHPSAAGLRAYVRDLREGLAFSITHPLTRSIALMVLVTNLIDAAVSGLLLLVWARSTGVGSAALGSVAAIFGAGAVCGAALLTAFAPRLPRRRTFAWAFLIAGAPRLLVLALPVPFTAVLVVWAVAGLAAGAINPILSAAQYDTIPPRFLARALAAVNAIAWAGIPFGALIAGIGTDLAGLTPTLFVLAGIYAVATVDPFVRRSWHAMDRRPSPTVPGPTPVES